jgi:hypothetical protein
MRSIDTRSLIAVAAIALVLPTVSSSGAAAATPPVQTFTTVATPSSPQTIDCMSEVLLVQTATGYAVNPPSYPGGCTPPIYDVEFHRTFTRVDRVCFDFEFQEGLPAGNAVDFDWNTVPPSLPAPAGSFYEGGFGYENQTGSAVAEHLLCLVAPTTSQPGHPDVWRFLDGHESFPVTAGAEGQSFVVSRLTVTLTGVAAATPANRRGCKHHGWRALTDEAGHRFRNQGQCVRWVERRDHERGSVPSPS